MSTHFTGRINVTDIRVGTQAGAARGLTLAVEHLLTAANAHVPHDEGTLERSGSTSVDAATGRGAVSYDTPYAVRQHEDMALSHDGKGQAKWLENAMTSEGQAVAQIIARAIRSETGG